MSPYDPDKHVWIIDDQQHLIWKFTYDGKLVMTLGTVGKRGRDGGKLFDRPTDIAWLPDGTFFISDGYGGTRVAKFDKDGKFLMDWGTPPKDPNKPGPNEWNTVHSIQISNDRKLYVVDRGHRRIQIFDENGKFLDMFTTGIRSSPYAHLITRDQSLWISDGGTQRIVKYDLKGNYLYGWGGPGGYPGGFNGPHSLTVDQEGNLYLAEVFNGRVQKFRPKKGADQAKVIGQELRYTARTSSN
jgi:peptidylamidoglycolate lyase